jgi:hypothetical protein
VRTKPAGLQLLLPVERGSPGVCLCRSTGFPGVPGCAVAGSCSRDEYGALNSYMCWEARLTPQHKGVETQGDFRSRGWGWGWVGEFGVTGSVELRFVVTVLTVVTCFSVDSERALLLAGYGPHG